MKLGFTLKVSEREVHYGEQTSVVGGQGDTNFAHTNMRVFRLKFIWFDFTKCYSKSEEINSFCPSVP